MYNQLTEHERYTLGSMNRAGFSARHIARVLDRSHTTIRRELSRNACHATDGAYRSSKARERTNGRRRRSRQISHHPPEIHDWIETVPQAGQWSPEQIADASSKAVGVPISHATIYRHVRKDQRQGGRPYRHLRQGGKPRRKRTFGPEKARPVARQAP